jgi:hypothetical protein
MTERGEGKGWQFSVPSPRFSFLAALAFAYGLTLVFFGKNLSAHLHRVRCSYILDT